MAKFLNYNFDVIISQNKGIIHINEECNVVVGAIYKKKGVNLVAI